ncbi:bZIP transcription factor 44 [Camellia lanceoleosa]|uniref:BZIP transcription factor 44 n=1 Tax=Camellia lanceoleosa TaxID=1840588 RepID=A0ACC0GR32_9ERIC|nr:bZIP transcription factor 44 [Camellia lanceoleosa]
MTYRQILLITIPIRISPYYKESNDAGVLSEILRSGFMINSSLRRRTHLVQSFSVVFLYCGNSSGSTHQIQNSGPEENLQVLMDQRKRKRMQSNRESARRSRMRKQKHLDDLVAELGQLRQENNQILTNIDITTQQHMNVESENSVLRAQMVELSHRLQSLNDILTYMNTNNGVFESGQDLVPIPVDNYMNNHPWNLMFLNQPIMASADMFQY